MSKYLTERPTRPSCTEGQHVNDGVYDANDSNIEANHDRLDRLLYSECVQLVYESPSSVREKSQRPIFPTLPDYLLHSP